MKNLEQKRFRGIPPREPDQFAQEEVLAYERDRTKINISKIMLPSEKNSDDNSLRSEMSALEKRDNDPELNRLRTFIRSKSQGIRNSRVTENEWKRFGIKKPKKRG